MGLGSSYIKKYAIVAGLLLGAWYGAFCLDLTQVNMRYHYDPSAPIQMDHWVIQSVEGVTVYLDLRAHKLDEWSHTLLLQQKYNSSEHDTLQVYQVDTLVHTSTRNLLSMTFDPGDQSVLVLSLNEAGSLLFYLEDIVVKSVTGFPSFIPYTDDLPIIDGLAGDTIVHLPEGLPFHVYRYREDFGPADPAMGNMKPLAPTLDIDSSYIVQDALSVANGYFYLIQQDSLDQSGVTILSVPRYFPKLRKVEELIPPLTYISTTSEIKELTRYMSRSSFESFWLKLYLTRFRAKNAIKAFYEDVQEANRLFTDYKQGWKTDRGIIYIVFGKPDMLTRDEQLEVWHYDGGIKFEFIRFSSLFTPFMYALRRDTKYEEDWYDYVGWMRKNL